MITTKSMFAKKPPSLIVKKKSEIVAFIDTMYRKGCTNRMIGEMLDKKRWTFSGAQSASVWSGERVKSFHYRNQPEKDSVVEQKEPIRYFSCVNYAECLDECAKANKPLYCELCERGYKKYASIQARRRDTQTSNIS